jgi:hypothetical protein
MNAIDRVFVERWRGGREEREKERERERERERVYVFIPV